jgi:hypothetical protein
MMRAHAELLCRSFGEDVGVRQFRKHAGWYLAGLPVGPEVRRRLSQAASPAEAHRLLDGLDPRLAFPEEARRVVRGHANGPKPVHLPAGWLAAADDPRPPAAGDILVSGG